MELRSGTHTQFGNLGSYRWPEVQALSASGTNYAAPSPVRVVGAHFPTDRLDFKPRLERYVVATIQGIPDFNVHRLGFMIPRLQDFTGGYAARSTRRNNACVTPSAPCSFANARTLCSFGPVNNALRLDRIKRAV